VDELCSLIHSATEGWDSRWFRGLKNPEHTLLPKLFRDEDVAKREGYISVEFRRRARSELAGMDSGFNWLCAMQHYGVPTRLLDWTESLAVALYFTVRPADLDLIAPTIWVLDPFELHRLSFPTVEIIPIPTDLNVAANADLAFCDDPDGHSSSVTKSPLPVAPDFVFRRLASQNGYFTIHGTKRAPLEEIIPTDKRSMLRKFVASRHCVSDIWNALDLLIPSSDAVFPDIEGISDYIV